MSLDDSEAPSSSTDTQKSSKPPKSLLAKPLIQKPAEIKSKKSDIETSPTRKQVSSSSPSQGQKQDLSDLSSQSEPNTPSGLSKTVDCDICGKPFGRNSLQFHTKHCKKKQQAQVRETFFSYFILCSKFSDAKVFCLAKFKMQF